MFETGTPVSGRDIIASLSRLQGEGEWWIGELPVDVFFASQDANWSPAEQVAHLIKSIQPVAFALGLPRSVLRLFFSARTHRSFEEIRDIYQSHLKGGAQAGRFAPSKRPAPEDPEATRKKIVNKWHTATASLLKHISDWPEPALDKSGLPHPILGRLSVREMLYFTLYHQSHHLKIAESRVSASTNQ